jgi:hypothetical protein
MKPIKIVSGGQTGADRATLDWAVAHNVPCGGWCPKGRKAEDAPIEPKYPLKETPSASYIQRTEWNLRDSDATVLFSIEPDFDRRLVEDHGFCPEAQETAAASLRGRYNIAESLKAFVEEHGVKVLNVAGPRASKEPGVGEFVMRTLEEAYGKHAPSDHCC